VPLAVWSSRNLSVVNTARNSIVKRITIYIWHGNEGMPGWLKKKELFGGRGEIALRRAECAR
jgi:hypothetical protein